LKKEGKMAKFARSKMREKSSLPIKLNLYGFPEKTEAVRRKDVDAAAVTKKKEKVKQVKSGPAKVKIKVKTKMDLVLKPVSKKKKATTEKQPPAKKKIHEQTLAPGKPDYFSMVGNHISGQRHNLHMCFNCYQSMTDRLKQQFKNYCPLFDDITASTDTSMGTGTTKRSDVMCDVCSKVLDRL
jgi:hypothetical protein